MTTLTVIAKDPTITKQIEVGVPEIRKSFKVLVNTTGMQVAGVPAVTNDYEDDEAVLIKGILESRFYAKYEVNPEWEDVKSDVDQATGYATTEETTSGLFPAFEVQ